MLAWIFGDCREGSKDPSACSGVFDFGKEGRMFDMSWKWLYNIFITNVRFGGMSHEQFASNFRS